ncbi:TfoX/Sxy family protein [Marivita hallyeonensis]|uniref:TfoX N-terminal domain-containing protein n=1 Tax=Marivita hallyeonensis TaxID=996342 RepID=A0A1M5XQI5_9RHOB|nr:TfoX/Sxy family protein [Marivita hallyeonensis]SHI01523.1 TfoX N-terminal domain-containing protein [Marivita hallyeonensis]
MAYDEEVAARVRNALSDLGDLREQKMMGALCFMVGDHMCCGVTGDALMVRVGRDDYEVALTKDYVRPMEMAGGRRPRGFVLVDPPGIETEEALARWIGRSRDFVSTLPAK